MQRVANVGVSERRRVGGSDRIVRNVQQSYTCRE